MFTLVETVERELKGTGVHLTAREIAILRGLERWAKMSIVSEVHKEKTDNDNQILTIGYQP